MTRVGELRDRVTVRRKVRVSDEAGGWTTSWRDWGVFWCQAVTRTGAAQFFSDGLREQETTLFTFRKGADVKIGDRILWRGINHEVQAMTPKSGAPRFDEARARVVQAGES